MKILQLPMSDKLESAMFFKGIVAVSDDYTLETFQVGEIMYEGENYHGDEIIKLGKNRIINDIDIDADDMTQPIDNEVDILVDSFFIIKKGGVIVDEDKYIYYDYDEAINGFKIFLSL